MAVTYAFPRWSVGTSDSLFPCWKPPLAFRFFLLLQFPKIRIDALLRQ